MPPPPTLPDELLEEIFLRLPPNEPEWLVRASLASKLWLGRLTGAAFRGRYGELHSAPPMLGFLLSWIPWDEEAHSAPHFIPTTKFGPRVPDWGQRKYEPLDCRHGRVLLADTSAGFSELAVWNPMTGHRRVMEAPDGCIGRGAAVLCAVTGCDHHACHQGPFRVLLFGFSTNDVAADQQSAHAWVYSCETDEWSEPCSALPLGYGGAFIEPRPSVLFENALHHTVLYADHTSVLKYDMSTNSMSLLDGPPLAGILIARHSAILMTMGDGSMGFAYLDCLTLYRWSRQIRADGAAAWTQRKIVDLKELLPIQNPENELSLIGFKEDSGILFVSMDLGIYEINLKTLEWKKLWKRGKIRALNPYMSFYNPEERPLCKAQH